MPKANCKLELDVAGAVFSVFFAPGFNPPQATHSVTFDSFCTMQVSQLHAPSGFLNLSPNPFASEAGGSLLDPVPALGLAVWQHTQVSTEVAFLTIQLGHSHKSLVTLLLNIFSSLKLGRTQ